jgi:hypothetical protein
MIAESPREALGFKIGELGGGYIVLRKKAAVAGVGPGHFQAAFIPRNWRLRQTWSA